MRKPFDRILLVSILLTVLYFWLIDKPTSISAVEDQKDIVFFGVLYIALIFGILSIIYIGFKKGK